MYFSLKTYENIFISPKSATGGLSKPQTLDEANAMFGKVQGEKEIHIYSYRLLFFFYVKLKTLFSKILTMHVSNIWQYWKVQQLLQMK